MTDIDEARAIARHADAVRRALGDEANDDAWASERSRIVDHELPRFNKLMVQAGRTPVEDRPGGNDAGRAIGLVRQMMDASAP